MGRGSDGRALSEETRLDPKFPLYRSGTNLRRPRARVRMTAVAGTEPVIMLTAPGPAATRCVENAGMTFDDISIKEPNLEDLFLKLTGRELRN